MSALHGHARPLVTLAMVLALVVLPGRQLQANAASHLAVNCVWGWAAQNCTEVDNSTAAFGSTYVGHDEPSTLFYSSQAGSGNAMQYQLTLPKDPPTPPAQGDSTTAYNFQLHPAFWFGMAMCDTQSYPEQVSTCTPDSDTNIKNNPDPTAPDALAKHAGTAFMEMQFYPPGWVLWPPGDSCDATKWCAALNIDSLSEDPVNGTVLNNACQRHVGIEYVNFAFLTLDGISQAPANPVQSTNATFTPDPTRDLFMNSGDRLVVSMRDTAHGLNIVVRDLTTHQTGSMTASAANGFGQVQYAPNGSSCTNIPYDFHPMYSTSSEQTLVPWAAHTYNIAFADEIGHFDYCTGNATLQPGGSCQGSANEGTSTDSESSDADDTYCFPASSSPAVQVAGCIGTNDPGFDGTAYQAVWPDGDTAHHPTPIEFTSPTTGGANYSRVAFEADLPRIEAADLGGVCNRTTGAGCMNPPTSDDGVRVNFYPFYSIAQTYSSCTWLIGNDVPGLTTNDFGKTSEYGSLLKSTYLIYGGGGTTLQRYNNYRQVLSSNPCPPTG